MLRRRCVKGTFFGTFFHARAERKYEKERRRTAVVAFDDVSALLQPYCMSVKAQTKLICVGYQVYFLLLVEEETRSDLTTSASGSRRSARRA